MKNTTKEKLNDAIEKMLNTMENKGENWVKSWSGASLGMPKNESTSKGYRGINILFLWANSIEKGYMTNKYMTYKQAVQLGGKVKKGERGTGIFFFTMAEGKKLGKDGKKLLYPMIKNFTVFNIEQIEGIKFDIPTIKTFSNERLGNVEDFINTMPFSIKHEGFQPCYTPTTDTVKMPLLEHFHDADNYYSTFFHELGHATGHKSRLDRDMASSSVVYGFEELIAELTSVFMCGEFNINIEKCQHAEYLNGWVSAIRENKNILWKAASEAQKATDLLLSYAEEVSEVA